MLQHPAAQRRVGAPLARCQALAAAAPRCRQAARFSRRPVSCTRALAEPQQRCRDYDADKEHSRVHRRITFDHELWAAHRSSNRYFRHTRGLLDSRTVRAIGKPLGLVAAIATAACAYGTVLASGLLPDWFAWPHLMGSTSQAFSTSTVALSLLLVFRTQSSYARWCEGRKLWGAVINRCRDVARQATQWLPVPEDRALTAAVCRWVSAFPCTLMASLRDDVDLRTCLAGVLLPAELELVMQQQHRGTAVLQMLGVCVKQSHASAIEKLRIDDSISALQDIMGGCERIFRTPIPLSYTRHTSRFLVAWLTCLPLCVEEQLGWSTLPLTCALVFFLLGIDEIGVQIEEPFGIMALETFCATVAHNVRQAAAMADAMHAAAALHAAPAQPLASAERTGAADGGPGSSSGSDAERVSGFTPPQPPPGVLPGLLQEQLQLADRSVGLYTSDENDLGGF